jgi:hypothetical protein
LAEHVLAAYEYRCGIDSHPVACGVRHGEELDAAIMRLGPENVAAFIAEPVAGAVLGAAVPPEDYWLSIANVCRRHGVLLIADEVMTGFGRTGRWFGLDHFGVRADLLVAGKGASSGYWPLGLCVASGRVTAAVEGGAGFVHGFTYSHHVVGAAVGLEVLRLLRDESLVARSALQGRRLLAGLRSALADEPHAGDVRGLGLMAGVELVADPVTRVPFARELRVTERVVAALTARGVLVYSSTGCADGTNGDLVLLGPPFVVSDAEIDEIVEAVAAAVREVTAGLRPELAD